MLINILKRSSMKPVLALALAAAGLQAGPGLSLAVGASPEPLKLIIGDTAIEQGQTVLVPVTVEPSPAGGVGSYNMQIDFDPASLEIVRIIPRYGSDKEDCSNGLTGCFQANYDNTAGWIRAIWVDSSGGEQLITGTQELFDVEVKAKVDSITGAKDLHIDSGNPEHLTFTDHNIHSLTAAITGGKLQVVPEYTPSPAPAAGPKPAGEAPDVKVFIDGKEQPRIAEAAFEQINNQAATIVRVDNEKVIEHVTSGNMKTILIPVQNANSAVVIGQLNGKLVKAMESKDAVVEIQTDRATYRLPASQIQIDSISASIGKEVALQDIQVSVKVSEAPESKVREVRAYAEGRNMSMVANPVEFEVEASHGEKKVTVSQFNSYVDRSIVLPEGVDPSRITTGVVMEQDGGMVHLPTRITVKDGKYYAAISSLTNSTYTVIWNPKAFLDVEQHWSRAHVNDLASRLVVQGTSENAFTPDRTITRAEFTSIVLRALGLHTSHGGAAGRFVDVPSGVWYEKALGTAAFYQLVSGYEDGTFRPDGSITREEAMVILGRAMSMLHLDMVTDPAAISRFVDSYADHGQVSPWAREAVASSIQHGIVEGSDNGNLKPEDPITRAQTAAIVHRMLIKSGFINGSPQTSE
jgi:hypothetical protein